jgi:hypothetical protein
MTPHLAAACGCGKVISIECPAIADIPAAHAKMVGWGHDERGFVKCPDCLDPDGAVGTGSPKRLDDGALSQRPIGQSVGQE